MTRLKVDFSRRARFHDLRSVSKTEGSTLYVSDENAEERECEKINHEESHDTINRRPIEVL